MFKEDEGIDLDNFSIEDEINKFEGLEANGWDVILRLYTAPKKKNGLIMPDSVHTEQQFTGCVGLVVKVAEGAYKDLRYSETGEWCKTGQWRIFPRHAGYKIYYEGIPLYVLKEDGIGPKVDDPSKITR